MATLSIHDVMLGCDFHPRKRATQPHGQGTRRMEPTPLSLLIRVFGACGKAPWFHEGITIDASMKEELGSHFPPGLDIAEMDCRLLVYGTGQGSLSADHSLRWGLTGYRSEGGDPVALHWFSPAEKTTLSRLFRQERLSRSVAPFRPLVQRIDQEGYSRLLAPVGIASQRLKDFRSVYFDLWFNAS